MLAAPQGSRRCFCSPRARAVVAAAAVVAARLAGPITFVVNRDASGAEAVLECRPNNNGSAIDIDAAIR